MRLSDNSFTMLIRNNSDVLKNSTNPWVGDNITSSEAGFDEIFSGIAPGIGEAGGIKHFEKIKNR